MGRSPVIGASVMPLNLSMKKALTVAGRIKAAVTQVKGLAICLGIVAHRFLNAKSFGSL